MKFLHFLLGTLLFLSYFHNLLSEEEKVKCLDSGEFFQQMGEVFHKCYFEKRSEILKNVKKCRKDSADAADPKEAKRECMKIYREKSNQTLYECRNITNLKIFEGHEEILEQPKLEQFIYRFMKSVINKAAELEAVIRRCWRGDEADEAFHDCTSKGFQDFCLSEEVNATMDYTG